MFGHWLRFNAVGLIGIGVQVAALFVLTRFLEVNYLLATFLAVEAAVLHNFAWHERWTWRERRGSSAMPVRLLRFHMANGLVSIIGNLVFMRLFVGAFGMMPVPANLGAIAICSVLNFLLSHLWVYGCTSSRVSSSAR